MKKRNAKAPPKPSKAGKSRSALTITHPNAAGIDIGSASHYVAVPPDRDDEPVREFPSFTADLHALADWLKACGVDTVAMESTGVYWIPLFELLEARGFSWSTRATSRTSRAASPTFSTANGCSSSCRMACSAAHSGPPMQCARCARFGASEACSCAAKGGMCSTCKRHSRR